MTLLFAITLILLCLNVFATLLIYRDEYSEKAQRVAQLLFVWLVPIIGAIAVWGLYRSEEKSPGKYREASEMEDFDPPESPLQSLNDAAGGSSD